MLRTKLISAFGASLIVASTGVMAALPASSQAPINSPDVTSGTLHTFAAGITRGYEISGFATMVRSPSNKTIVDLKAFGLMPETTYPAHVHNKACDDNNGGGHYQNEVGGPVNSTNEIWVTFTTNSQGVGEGFAKNDFYSRPEAQSIVIHDTDLARIACVDLE